MLRQYSSARACLPEEFSNKLNDKINLVHKNLKEIEATNLQLFTSALDSNDIISARSILNTTLKAGSNKAIRELQTVLHAKVHDLKNSILSTLSEAIFPLLETLVAILQEFSDLENIASLTKTLRESFSTEIDRCVNHLAISGSSDPGRVGEKFHRFIILYSIMNNRDLSFVIEDPAKEKIIKTVESIASYFTSLWGRFKARSLHWIISIRRVYLQFFLKSKSGIT